MAAFPAMPFYTDAYLADTRHLTTEEHGAYLLLLMCAWRTRDCKLADDDKSLARITGLSPTRWRRMRPVLEQFFDITCEGWHQKKLSAVYKDVAARVTRNRTNGARGGRARQAGVAGDILSSPEGATADVVEPLTSQRQPKKQAAKTKAKTKSGQRPAVKEPGKGNAAAPEKAETADLTVCELSRWRREIEAVCAPDTRIDEALFYHWHAAAVDLMHDVLPTIASVQAREVARTGQPPLRLGYYRDAVLEASCNRQKAVATGSRAGRAAAAKPQSRKRAFDPSSTSDWALLLGDETNRFRGDYLAQNWFVSADHPVFRERSLGPNPRFGKNPHIPESIYARYARPWLWL